MKRLVCMDAGLGLWISIIPASSGVRSAFFRLQNWHAQQRLTSILSSLRTWDDVIQRQLRRMENLSTVHTGIPVTQEDVLPAQNLDANRNVTELLQPDNRRTHNAGVDFLSCVLLNHSPILADQCESASAGTNRNRFEARISGPMLLCSYS